MPIDSSLKSESIDISYMVLIKKLKKCEANSEFSELKNFCSELLSLNLNNSELHMGIYFNVIFFINIITYLIHQSPNEKINKLKTNFLLLSMQLMK